MFENIMNFFKRLSKKEKTKESSDTAKERLHLVLMQDRANVSADFLELMKQEIIEVIKKYIDIDEKAIDVKLTNKSNDDGTVGAPALYANIPIITIRNEARKLNTPQINENASQKEGKAQQEQKQEEDYQEETRQEKSKNDGEENIAKNQESKELKQENKSGSKEKANVADMQEKQESVSEIQKGQETKQEIENNQQEQTEKQTEEQEIKAQVNLSKSK